MAVTAVHGTARGAPSAVRPLVGAILVEVTASVSLRAALDQPGLYAVAVLGFAAAFTLLARVLRAGMALGAAYGIWGASSVALTAALDAVVFGEALTAPALGGIALIIAGVLLVELGAQRGRRAQEART